jgi:uncharacterized protein (DUF1778 family)
VKKMPVLSIRRLLTRHLRAWSAEVGMKDENPTALLVRCTSEEAKLIHDAAKREHRTLSGYILHVVMSRIRHHDEVIADSQHESVYRLK